MSKYATATDFRRALEERLKIIARKEGTDIQRLRRQVAFDRLANRLFYDVEINLVLKGGYTMELRYESARMTKDIDLSIHDAEFLKQIDKDPKQAVQILLQRAARLELGDYFVFLIGSAKLDLEGAPYGGYRYPVETLMDGRNFVSFHVDVGIGDVLIKPIEHLTSRDWLDFAKIPTQAIPTISREQQFSEKIHAYTLPRPDRENSRVKDLVDLLLLINLSTLDRKILRRALQEVFDRRASHPLPTTLLPPPAKWAGPYSEMAIDCKLAESIDEAFAKLGTFFSAIF